MQLQAVNDQAFNTPNLREAIFAADIRLHHLPLIADLLTMAPTVFCDLE
jgi:hypothetical protein